MNIAFVGDVHGRVFHCIAGLLSLQGRMGKTLDLVIQVGDFGYPFPERMDAPSKRYRELDATEGDVSRLFAAESPWAESFHLARRKLGGPILFIRGNHEDFDWLRSLEVEAKLGIAKTDPYDLFRYVPDGAVLSFEGFRIAFMGGVEERTGDAGIEPQSYDHLLALDAGYVDLLITHQGPFGSSAGFRGDIHGSRLISELLSRLQPRFHVFGHAHQQTGPQALAHTTYLGLDALVASAKWEPDAKGLKLGCFGVLDTESGDLRPIMDPWLAGFPTPFDFEEWISGRWPGRMNQRD